LNFEQLLKANYNDAVRFSRSLAGSKANGDDLLQEALIRAWKGFPRLKDAASFKSWLLKIISNTHRSMCRRWWIKHIVGLDAALDIPHPTALPYEEKELVRLAMRGVPRAQREALILFEVLGMKVAEVAAHQKVSQSAVKSRLARGRAKLKTRYETLSKMETCHNAEPIRTG